MGGLPADTLSQDYALEYGTDRLEVHVDAGFAHLFDVACNDIELGVFRDAGHAKLTGHGPFVDDTGIVMLAMLDQILA